MNQQAFRQFRELRGMQPVRTRVSALKRVARQHRRRHLVRNGVSSARGADQSADNTRIGIGITTARQRFPNGLIITRSYQVMPKRPAFNRLRPQGHDGQAVYST